MSVRIVLDTDIGSDVDDALALAFALRHPEIELAAVTTVADDTQARAAIARALLRAAGRDDVPVGAGVGWAEPPNARRSWFGHELELLEGSDAVAASDGVELLLEMTRTPHTEVATVGMPSNIAAALDRDPGVASRIARLIVMGGVFGPVAARHEVAGDHNLSVDPKGSLRALSAGLNTLYVPLDVTVRAILPTAHVDALRGGDELCRVLARHLEVWRRAASPPEGVAALLHDPLAVACAVDRRFVTSETLPVAVSIDGGVVHTHVDEHRGSPCEVITGVEASGFADFWLETVLG